MRNMVRSKAIGGAGGEHRGAQPQAGKAQLQRERKGAPFNHRVDVRGLYLATKQQGYGRGKQGGRSHGRAELLVQEREIGRESHY